MSQRPCPNDNGVSEAKRKRCQEQIREEIKELQTLLWSLQHEKAYLLRILAASKDDNASCSSCDEPLDSSNDDIQKLELECDYLLREMADKEEENEDLYNTLLDISSEKEQIKDRIEHSKQELEACKSVIDFLVLERDQLKLEIRTKDQLLECYKALYNKENMFHFRTPRSKQS